MSERITFTVAVRLHDTTGVSVQVYDERGGEYARIDTRNLHTALRMAVPYMHDAAQPDALQAVLRRDP